MTSKERPLCDCPEACTCYAKGYAAGQDKAYFEIKMALHDDTHTRQLRLPAQPDQAGLPRDDVAGQQLVGTGGP